MQMEVLLYFFFLISWYCSWRYFIWLLDSTGQSSVLTKRLVALAACALGARRVDQETC